MSGCRAVARVIVGEAEGRAAHVDWEVESCPAHAASLMLLPADGPVVGQQARRRGRALVALVVEGGREESGKEVRVKRVIDEWDVEEGKGELEEVEMERLRKETESKRVRDGFEWSG